jgi:16S rRNA (uracil1498-N3)-methyltransferase
MPHNRFFIDKDTLLQDEIISISDDEFRHIKVMRLEENDTFEIINGQGILAIAKLESISKREAQIKIISLNKKENCEKLVLIQALLISNKLSLIVEKATELGIDEIIFYLSSNCEKKSLSNNDMIRFKKIAISSSKQCGRLYLPKINYINSLDKLNINGPLFYGDIDAKSYLEKKDLSTDKKNHFIIGPEKGFSNIDLKIINDQLNAKSIKLNQNILRAETASICACSIFAFFAN